MRLANTSVLLSYGISSVFSRPWSWGKRGSCSPTDREEFHQAAAADRPRPPFIFGSDASPGNQIQSWPGLRGHFLPDPIPQSLVLLIKEVNSCKINTHTSAHTPMRTHTHTGIHVHTKNTNTCTHIHSHTATHTYAHTQRHANAPT